MDSNREYALESMKWYGWGSPIGLAVFLIGVGVFSVLIRWAVSGCCHA